MKPFIIIFICFFYNISFCQSEKKSVPTRDIKGKEIEFYLDSLKSKILMDTIKFNRKDLIHSNMGTRNTKTYSPLFIIDKCQYKLDIINGKLVKEFADEILDYLKIESIAIISPENSRNLFGRKGENGAIWMSSKKGTKINFNVAGLKTKKRKKLRNNFNQRQNGEITILY
jgi:hypothetical protein